MKIMVKTEEVFLFFLSIFLFAKLEFSWWWFPALLLIPDIGMAGYFFNNKIGAIIYNIIHHRAVSVCLYIIGAIIHSPVSQLIGIILFAHSTIDRVFNFGFKYLDNFKHTHLNEINYDQ